MVQTDHPTILVEPNTARMDETKAAGICRKINAVAVAIARPYGKSPDGNKRRHLGRGINNRGEQVVTWKLRNQASGLRLTQPFIG